MKFLKRDKILGGTLCYYHRFTIPIADSLLLDKN